MLRRNTIVMLALLMVGVFVTSAMAVDMSAKIRIEGGGTYDYVIIGMNPDATDGHDNKYDIFAASGNMNSEYIEAYFSHPEWNKVKDNFRGDIKSLANTQQWIMTVYTNFAAGTPMSIVLGDEGPDFAGDFQYLVRDMDTNETVDISAGNLQYTVSANSSVRSFEITANALVDLSQYMTYTLSGQVVDQRGNGIDKARIKLKGASGNYKATTDASGYFAITGLPDGSYKVSVQARKYRARGMIISVNGADTVLNISGRAY
jgi:hypothetical protein